jgi:hypothetical protein
MLITIKRRVFQKGWEKLILHPFKDGVIISVISVPPSYLIYFALMYTIKDELISFSILCTLLAGFLAFAFFKRPTLLGNEFAELQKELMKLVKNKEKKGPRRRKLEEEKTDFAEITK